MFADNTNRPALSIIICTYNRKAALERICEQLFQQFKSLLIYAENPQALVADLELIIVDSSSTDGTGDLISEILDKKKNNHLEINYIKEVHQDFAITRNRAIKEACGSFLAFVDDDLRLANNWLELVYQLAIDNSGVIAYGARVLPDWLSAIPDWLILDSKWGLDQRFLAIHDYQSNIRSYPFYDLTGVEITSLSFSCFFCSREIFQKYGVLKDDLLVYGEKRSLGEAMEFFHRLITAGASLQYYPDLVVYRSIPAKLMNPQVVLKWYEQWGEIVYYLQKNDLYHIPSGSKVASKYKLHFKLFVYKALHFAFEIVIDPIKSFWAKTEIAKIKGALIQIENSDNLV